MRGPVESYLEQLHARFSGLDEGAVADYIPTLGRANPDWFGICLATADGRVYEVGDTRQPFTIQSMSKPFTYGLALQQHGLEAVAAKVGVEPSGDAFNSISLEPGTGRPRNPMINAGAITASSLVGSGTASERFQKILDAYSVYAARPLTLDEETYESESSTGHRNRAIGHMLRTFGIVQDEVDRALEVYFRQCSVLVDCHAVALMAATLANGGRNPLTAARATPREYVQHMLSVMTSCGMYDGSGRWMDQVGLPAKSGVAGGIFAVLPGQFGLCVFSPPLDEQGNSVRGVTVCRALTAELELHSLRAARASQSTIRASYDVATVPSRRRRQDAERQVLAEAGRSARVWALQGDVLFAGAEAVLHAVGDVDDDLEIVVIDLRGVSGVGGAAKRMLDSLHDALEADGKELVIVGGESGRFGELEDALEYCEERLLATHGGDGAVAPEVTLADHQLCRGIDAEDLEELDRLLEARRVNAGELVFGEGDQAAHIYLLMDGEVSIEAVGDDGVTRRLVTQLPGSSFGELAVLGRGTRTASVRAHEDVSLRVLPVEAFDLLAETRPRLQACLLRNLPARDRV